MGRGWRAWSSAWQPSATPKRPGLSGKRMSRGSGEAPHSYTSDCVMHNVVLYDDLNPSCVLAKQLTRIFMKAADIGRVIMKFGTHGREKKMAAKQKGRHYASSDEEGDGTISEDDLPANDDPFFQHDDSAFDDPFFQVGVWSCTEGSHALIA